MIVIDTAEVNSPRSRRRMSAQPGLSPVNRLLTSAREQPDIPASREDWRPGHPDRPLTFRWRVDYATLLRILDLPVCKSRRGERAMASIVYDAALSAREDSSRRISYSRRKAFYSAIGRYDGTDYSYATLVPAVDALVAAGLLVDHDRVKGGPFGTGVQSSFRPAPALADIVLPRAEYRVGELVRLRDDRGALVPYRDSEPIVRDRRFLETLNRSIAGADIRLEGINGVVIDEQAGTIFFPGFLQWLDDGYDDHTVYTSMKELYRVYNGSWTLGGRIYGGWWQQVRKRDRRYLTIDGGATVELDYEMLHPRLLYAEAGQLLSGDAYALDGWDRPACKRAFNVLLNARNYQSALGAILPHVGYNRRTAAALITALKKRHAAVADRFHSGAGLRLQNIDAEMAKLVLRDLTVRKGITVLPVHDSFVARKEHQSALEEAMDKAFLVVTESIGNRVGNSKGWRRIVPHRGGAQGRGGVPMVGTGQNRILKSSTLAAQPVGLRGAESTVAGRPAKSLLPALSPASDDRDASREDITEPGADHVSGAQETAPGTAISAPVVSDTGEPDEGSLWPRKPQQSIIEATAPQATRVAAKVIRPPAFLNRANWSAGTGTELHRRFQARRKCNA